MYCSTCELEIKGDDKDTCPVCGGALSASLEKDSPQLSHDGQAPSGAEDIFNDTDSPTEPLQDSPPIASDQEDVFVLQDYTPDSLSVEQAQTPEEPVREQGGDELPLPGESVKGAEADVNDMLDSIRESLATSGKQDAEQPAENSNLDSLDVDFGSFDSFGDDTASGSILEENTDGQAQVIWDTAEAASAVPMPEAAERRKSPVFKIVLIFALIIVGSYYVFTLRSGDEDSLVNEPVESIVAAEFVNEETEEISEIVQPAAGFEETIAGEETAGIEPVDPAVAGETQAAMPIAGAEAEALVEAEETAGVEPVDPAVAGETQAAMPIAGAEAETVVEAVDAIAAEEIAGVESVDTAVAEEPGAVNPGAGAQAEALVEVEEGAGAASVDPVAARKGEAVKPAAPQKAEAAVPVQPAPVKAPFFTVHVGSYQKRVSAASEVARIEAKGYDAFIERVDLGKKGIWYRVKVGRFKDRAEAEQLQRKIKKVLVLDSMVVTHRTN